VPPPWAESLIPVSSEQERHLSKVLRADPGREISYTDGVGNVGRGTWAAPMVERGEESQTDRPSRLVMAVAPPANKDRLRFVVEKLAELGTEKLLWLATRRGAGRLPSSGKQQAWATSALEQSRGAWLMEVGSDLVGWSDLEPPVLVCQPDGSAAAGTFQPRTIAIGPEGGFDIREVPDGFESVTLGETVLRVETAAVVAATKFLE
jgi:16S rRNA (uracil1498-N3)-methyltransferase